MGLSNVLLLWIVTILMVVSWAQNDVRKPPNILEPDSAKTLYYPIGPQTVQCNATGTPKPMYKWMKDQNEVQPTERVSYDSSTGVLTFRNFTNTFNGVYMCMAYNKFDSQPGQITAASLSPPLTIMQIEIGSFVGINPIDQTANQYAYVTMRCDGKGKVVGPVAYNWHKAEGNNDQIPLDNGRRYIDLDGNMHITYVKEDENNLKIVCGISNVDARMILLGRTYNLLVNRINLPTAIIPTLQFSSNPSNLYKRFQDATLECVFSGYDPSFPNLPVIKWYDDQGKEIVTVKDKYALSSEGRRLTIMKVQEEDERNYYCEGKNSAGGSGQKRVFLNVTSAPIFYEDKGGPTDVITSEYKNATFYCRARSAINEAPPQPPIWYINGARTGSHTDKRKILISNDQTQLTVVDVRKANDILCVQCEVTNHIGTTWGDACLTVLLPITITFQPPLKQEIDHGDTVDLTVRATTDPDRQLSYKWGFANGSDSVTPPPHVTYNPDTNTAYINTSKLSESEYETIGGIYRRVIYHKDDSKIVQIEVILKDKPAIGTATAGGSGIDMWIIGLIIGILFLIIVIIIIIFVICRKQQEGDYNVDKKETGAGLDPEKELKNKDFHEFSRPDYNDFDYPDKKPRGDLEYDDVPIGVDDESLAEYGGEDDVHFNEDGSFIGIYQNKDQQQQQQQQQAPHLRPNESTI